MRFPSKGKLTDLDAFDREQTVVSKRTVQRSVHLTGFRSRRPTRVTLLNTRHTAARLARAREHKDWKRKIWNDES
ncbi:hypothetical protein TNCV_4229051 [Trichonephila clavipes]|nr:hypothetical protein TNCV_4229051 [Trichonephila clavipes]